jgi:cytochrome b561
VTDSSPSPNSKSNPRLTIAEPACLRYSSMAILLHWLLFPMIVVTFGVGLYMSDLAFSPTRIRLYNWHKWAGVTILMLSALRLLWRLANPPPALSARMESVMPPWQRKAHRSTHALFYVLFFAVPLLGWAYSSAAGFQVVWFGVLPLPDFVPVNRDLADAVLKPAHQVSAFLLAAIVLVHVGVALKHHFIDRDGLLARMWFAPRTE